MQRKGRVLEFWGGCLPTILHFFPFYSGSPVATFGQVVLGRSSRYLNACRMHQLVHVLQYERWGLLFCAGVRELLGSDVVPGQTSVLRQPFRAVGILANRELILSPGPRE